MIKHDFRDYQHSTPFFACFLWFGCCFKDEFGNHLNKAWFHTPERTVTSHGELILSRESLSPSSWQVFFHTFTGGRKENMPYIPQEGVKEHLLDASVWSPFIANYNKQVCSGRNEDISLEAALTREFIIFQQRCHCFSMTGSPKNAQWLSPHVRLSYTEYGKYLQQQQDRKTLIRWQNTEPSIF